MMKYLIASRLDAQLDSDAGFMSKWVDGKFSASERRILITKWIGEAWEQLCDAGYIRKYFEKTGCLIGTTEEDHRKIKIQGLPDYKFDSTTTSSLVIHLDESSSDSEINSNWCDSDGSAQFSDDQCEDEFSFTDSEAESSSIEEQSSSPNDHVLAESPNDHVLGESSNDHVLGESSNDHVLAENDVVHVYGLNGESLCKGILAAQRKTLHCKPIPDDHAVVFVLEVQNDTGLGVDSFGESIGIGGYFAAPLVCMRKSEQ